MSKLDRIREEIGWLKLVFGVLVAIDVSLAGWLFQNYTGAAGVLLILGLVAMFILTGAIMWINRRAYRRIGELEEF